MQLVLFSVIVINPESVYFADNAGFDCELAQGSEEEILGRYEALERLQLAIAKDLIKPKKLEDARKSLLADREVFEGMLSEYADAFGVEAADRLRERCT